jgi:hypothetical protein
MAGDAEERINMQVSLGEPFGMALNGFSGVMALGTFTVDLVAGHKHWQFDFMRVMAVIACGF